jgi:ribosomal protein L11 methyltransferase
MNTIQISIKAAEAEQEILIGLLCELGANGFEQKDDYLLAYFPENDFNSYEVNELVKNYNHNVQTIPEQNWNALWESNFPPVIVEDFCAVRADFHPAVEGVTFEILIMPKMSFGTGHHATTYMMMHQMKDMEFKGRTVFDFGTGTGILSILAEKLGAEKVFGIDVDDWSIRNARENIDKNNCTRIEVSLTSVLPVNKYDIVLANINRNVILDYMEQLKQLIVDEGYILFSGLLVQDEKDILNDAAHELVLVNREEKDNWLSLLCKMKTQPGTNR